MAEKQLAYRAGGKDEFFADDDPLAELARIVGFDPRPAVPVAANQRQEPAFDLEDELLREFERYDAPRAEPTVVAQQQAAVQARFAEEPAAAYAPPAEPAYQAPAYEQSSWHTEPAAPVASDESQEARWEPAEESWELQSSAAPTPASNVNYSAPVAAEQLDLSQELEMSIEAAPAVAPVAKTPQWAAASIRLPLANFNAPRREPIAPEAAAAPPAPAIDIAPPAPVADFETPVTSGFPAEQDRHEPIVPETLVAPTPAPVELPAPAFDLIAAARDGRVEPDAALTEPAYTTAQATSSVDIDDLLADVSRYPVPSRDLSARLEPAIAVAPEPVEQFDPIEAIAAQPDAFVQPQQAPVAEPIVDEIDPFDDHEFDFDLAEIELELAELDLAEAQVTPSPVVVAQTAAPVVAAKPVAPAPADEDWLNIALAPVKVSPAAAVETPRAAEPVQVQPESFMEPEQELPFDPSEISDTEDRLETFEDMHVPALPPVEEIEPIAPAPDFDFDIDAEMANLFSAPTAETPAEPLKSASPSELAMARIAAASVQNGAFKKPVEGLDEFERALEEDFRRSFRETPLPHENASQMMFESSALTSDRWRARSMRGFAIAAGAVIVIGAGAYGVYGWMSHGSSTLGFTSGEPRVIVADKDPVKVVPENPGGKVVPNQDKAVYDRVAGDSSQAPKQKALVTSDEQPVDVVQKTLIPEAALPDDSEGDPNAGAPTPVGETEDPRLLPNQTSANPQTASNQDDVPAVAPRKVRTMIVRPDGTLVPREDDTPAVAGTQKPAPALANPTKPAAASTPMTQMAAATPAPADNDAASAESTPIRVVKTSNLADDAPAGNATPVPAARPTAPAAAPVAAATPPAVPVKPVATTKPAAAPKPSQVASATPAPQPVKATTETAASSGGYGMQIASLPSEEEAKRSQVNQAAKFASVIGGRPTEIRKVDIPGKGTYYRVRVPVGSKDDAAALCVKLRAAGGTCLISK